MPEETTNQLQAIILAGGINKIELYAGYKPGYKALLEFNGNHSINYTLQALTQSKYIKEKIGIVGPQKELSPIVKNYNCEFIAEGNNILESIFKSLEHYKNESAVLITTADIPLIKSEAVDEFINESKKIPLKYKENFYISVIPKEKFSGEYKSSDKAMNKFKDIEICHGNLFLVNPALLDNHDAVGRINNIYNSRKSPIKSALATGLMVGISYIIGVHLLHILTLKQMSAIASKRFGIGFVPVVSSYPEIAVDIDEPADYKLLSDILLRRVQS